MFFSLPTLFDKSFINPVSIVSVSSDRNKKEQNIISNATDCFMSKVFVLIISSIVGIACLSMVGVTCSDCEEPVAISGIACLSIVDVTCSDCEELVAASACKVSNRTSMTNLEFVCWTVPVAFVDSLLFPFLAFVHFEEMSM